MEWFTYPEHLPPVDEDGDSDYLLIACDRAVTPLAGYFDGHRNQFHMLGNAQCSELRGVRAWAYYPKLPAALFDSPLLLKHARQGGLIEE